MRCHHCSWCAWLSRVWQLCAFASLLFQSCRGPSKRSKPHLPETVHAAQKTAHTKSPWRHTAEAGTACCVQQPRANSVCHRAVGSVLAPACGRSIRRLSHRRHATAACSRGRRQSKCETLCTPLGGLVPAAAAGAGPWWCSVCVSVTVTVHRLGCCGHALQLERLVWHLAHYSP